MKKKFALLINDLLEGKRLQHIESINTPLENSIIKRIIKENLKEETELRKIDVSNSTLCQSPQQFAIGR